MIQRTGRDIPQLGLGRFLDEIELADGVTSVAATATCRNIKPEAAVFWIGWSSSHVSKLLMPCTSTSTTTADACTSTRKY